MKTTKRILSIALSILLGISLFAPAVSAAADPNAPMITMQPKSRVVLFAGKMLTLEVTAALPAGNNGTLSIAWYDYDWQPGDDAQPISTEAKLTISTTPDMLEGPFMISIPSLTYCAVVTNTYVDEAGQERTSLVKSNLATVNVFPTISSTFSVLQALVWNIGSFADILKTTEATLDLLILLAFYPGFYYYSLIFKP